MIVAKPISLYQRTRSLQKSPESARSCFLNPTRSCSEGKDTSSGQDLATDHFPLAPTQSLKLSQKGTNSILGGANLPQTLSPRGRGSCAVHARAEIRDVRGESPRLFELSLTDEPRENGPRTTISDSGTNSSGRLSSTGSAASTKELKGTPNGSGGSAKVRKAVKALQSGFLLSQGNVCTILEETAGLLTNDLTSIHGFADKGGIQALISVMRRFEDLASTQAQSCELLLWLSDPDVEAVVARPCPSEDYEPSADKMLSVNDRWIAIRQAGGIEAVLVALLKHESNRTLQEVACQVIRNLALDEENREYIAECSGIEVILTSMQANESSSSIQVATCRALCSLSLRHPRNVCKIAALKGIRCVKRAHELHRGDAEVQTAVCNALRNLTIHNDPNRGSIAREEGIENILATVKRFTNDKSLLVAAVGALWNLTVRHRQNANTIIQAGGVSIIFQVLKLHESCADLQAVGIGTLRNLTEGDQHALRIGSDGGIPLLLTAMRQHEKNHTILEHGCGSLCNLACIPSNQGPMASAGGIGCIVNAMSQLLQNVDVQKNGCTALRILARSNKENQVSVAAAGGIKAALMAMDEHTSNAGLQGLALQALVVLSQIPRNQQLIVKNGGIRIISTSMERHPKLTQLHQAGKALLLLLDPENISDYDKLGNENSK